jgi:hypothetical protein
MPAVDGYPNLLLKVNRCEVGSNADHLWLKPIEDGADANRRAGSALVMP